jgi:hypothetical protein
MAVESAPEGKVTARHVAMVVKGLITKENLPDPEVITTGTIETYVDTDSNSLSGMKALWNDCNNNDKRLFVKWIKEYFYKFIK